MKANLKLLPESLSETIKKNELSESLNIEKIAKAYNYALEKHKGQLRLSGEPYIIHPVEVAKILLSLNLDTTSVVAGLLHDVVEDCNVSIEEIEREFGSDVAKIVDGLTKIESLDFNIPDAEAKIESIRKMILAMASDIRVILVKLADRLHNMRTLSYLKDEKKIVEKSQETLSIYAPIAHRLGIHMIKWELEDLAFKYLYPDEYKELKEKVSKKLAERQEITESYRQQLESFLKEHGIECRVEGRVKHFYSIWQKMKRKNRTFDEIYDLIALRVITGDEVECYKALGFVHSLWTPVPGRIKDYIATPKSNGYRALHTTVITQRAELLEIQIRSFEMHKEAEYGLAAHWRYKEDLTNTRYKWIDQLIEWQKDFLSGVVELGELQNELNLDEVFVFTPKGEVKHLPKGSTTIDFAYSVHTEIGHHYAGAKVNGKIVPIDYKLKNGDIVEIIVNKNSKGPSLDWLKYARSSSTRAKIRKYFKDKYAQELIEKGKEIFRKVSKKLNMSIEELLKEEKIVALMRRYSLKAERDLFIRIGDGMITQSDLLKLLQPEEDTEFITRKPRKKTKTLDVIVDGATGVEVRFAKCCMPIPGDSIVGIITKSAGISVHRKNCKNVTTTQKDRLIKVRWAMETKNEYDVWLEIETFNTFSVSELYKSSKPSWRFYEINTKIVDNNFLYHVVRARVRSKEELDDIIQSIKKMKDVIRVRRTRRK
ncbi:MAG: diphosphokinase / guanosine-3,5-bis(diphosphate) 3-diphosphatase [Thermotogaceae bacterium]|nr:diphosphokinase / guanosine-3,5-bis(diphosphate) 3-diphosphatase [Thermotogaceae bacterium]MDN5338389.1 diphosphokinase / guanosine-3,5-bis(diphosphate) 3-diphosphatase [Thermotogaceae bacterium]